MPGMFSGVNAEILGDYIFPLHFDIHPDTGENNPSELAYILQIYPTHSNFIRPISSLSVYLDYYIWGLNYYGYHLTTFLLHVINCLLIFIFLRRLKVSSMVSYISVLLFAFHPIAAYSTVTAINRTDILATVFIMLATINYLTYLQRGRRVSFLLASLFFLLGVFSKEIALSFPFLILGVSYILFDKSTWSATKKRSLIGFGFFMFLVISFLILRKAVFGNLITHTYMEEIQVFLIMKKTLSNLMRTCYATFLVFLKPELGPIRSSLIIRFIGLLISLILLFTFLKAGNRKLKFGIFWMFAAAFPILPFGWAGLWVLYLPLVGLPILTAGILETVRAKKIAVQGVYILTAAALCWATMNSTWIIRKLGTYYGKKELISAEFIQLFPEVDEADRYYILFPGDYADKALVFLLPIKYNKPHLFVRWILPGRFWMKNPLGVRYNTSIEQLDNAPNNHFLILSDSSQPILRKASFDEVSAQFSILEMKNVVKQE
jgi:hypothetical protein